MNSPRIVFMGTPEFAVASLGSLLMNGYNIVTVVTTPDKPSGRGQKVSGSAVKEFAESAYLPVLQPENISDSDFIDRLKKLNPDIFIVVAFRLLPEKVWKIPAIGTFNLHASLLPQYRGAAPVNHVLINGEKVTGVTTFLIDDKIDTGNILLREEVPIFPYENAGDLHDKLMKHGARLVIRTLEGLIKKSITPQPQTNYILPGERLKSAPKIYPADCFINWNNEPEKIHNLIRGLSPYPCARSEFVKGDSSVLIKIYESQPEHEAHIFKNGQIISDGKKFVKIACKGGFINLIQLQAEGKKKLSAVEFLRGFRITDYYITVN